MNSKLFYAIVSVAISASVFFWVFMFQDRTESESSAFYEGEITLTMYHGEGCMCCLKWAQYLEENGVTVVEELVDNPHEIRHEKGVSAQLSSCHTAIVDGYVVEGHVPVEDIRRLLAERPDVIGISVPGMPPGAPGMDAPVSRPYDVLIFDSNENIYVYNRYE